MRPLLIVTLEPVRSDFANLLSRLEHIRIQHFRPIRPIEPLDEGVLYRPLRLDIAQLDPTHGTPGHEAVGYQFRRTNLRAQPLDALADAIVQKETPQQILQRLSSMTARCTTCHVCIDSPQNVKRERVNAKRETREVRQENMNPY